MNRGVLIGLLLLVAAAVGGVLVLSGPGEQPDPLGGYESPGQDDSSESGPQVAQPGGTGNRTASEPVLVSVPPVPHSRDIVRSWPPRSSVPPWIS